MQVLSQRRLKIWRRLATAATGAWASRQTIDPPSACGVRSPTCRTQKIKCACLEKKVEGQSTYTIDPRWKGNSAASKDKAFINLIFEVPGEGLREIAGGLETPSGTEKAWKMQRVTRQ